MRLRYCFAHVWEHPRTVWEDVYLLPDHPDFEGPGVHLTVVGVGGPDIDPEDRAAAIARLAGREYLIDKTMGDMFVHTDDFSKSELLTWTRRFLQDIGVEYDQLVEAPVSFFLGRIDHADFVAELTRQHRLGHPPEANE